MERFGLKRHVVRQALSALEQMGAVERRRNVGALVRAFEPEEVVELFGLRELLEAQAAALIPLPVPPVRLQALVAVQRRHDAAVAAGDAHAVFRINQQFHRELFALAGNTVLLQAIAEYARRTHPIRFGSLATAAYRERARREHWAMIDALRADAARSWSRCAGSTCSPRVTPTSPPSVSAPARSRVEHLPHRWPVPPVPAGPGRAGAGRKVAAAC